MTNMTKSILELVQEKAARSPIPQLVIRRSCSSVAKYLSSWLIAVKK